MQLRKQWRVLRCGRPGHRFQASYERSRQENGRSNPAKRILFILLAVVFLAIAAVLTVMPGPAFVFFILAGALFAMESKAVARFMDWLEVRIRNLLCWAKRRWRSMTPTVRAVVVGLGVAGAAGFAYIAYRFLTR